MSRLTSKEVRSLAEAYNQVYAPQITEEQIWEEIEFWVDSILEEGYDLSDYTWDDIYLIAEDAVGRQGRTFGRYFGDMLRGGARNVRDTVTAAGRNVSDTAGAYAQGFLGQKTTSSSPTAQLANTASRAMTAPVRGYTRFVQGTVEGLTGKKTAPAPQQTKPASTPAAPASTPAAPASTPPRQTAPRQQPAPSAAPASRPASSGGGSGTTSSAPRGQGSGSQSAPAASAKPAGQTGDKAKDMDTWAKANPKLAAAATERQRIRGTQQTDNPLMKDFKSRLPMNSPSVQSPDVAKLGKGFQSLSQNPNAFKAAPAKPAPAATKPAAAPSAPPAPAPAPAPAATKPVRPAATGSKKPGSIVSHYDPFDIVIGYLLDEGYADTEEAALAIMSNMSEGWKNYILS